MSEAKHNPGDIVELGGVKFVVLDNDYGGVGDLFILALETQGESKFGGNNEYTANSLNIAVKCWWADFAERILTCDADRDSIMFRTLDLTTLDGRRCYGTLHTVVAPLTLDEARKYAGVIPPCDKPWWLATGWGGPGRSGSTLALGVDANGNWTYYFCSSSRGIRPALVIDPVLLEQNETPDQDIPQIPDLSGCSTDDLLAEIKRRMED